MSMKTCGEGASFNGRIGRTWTESEPAFPVKPKAPDGAPNVVYIVLDDVGFGWCDTFGGLVETPNITRAGRERLAVHQLSHHGVVFSDALMSIERAQPSLKRDGQHHRIGDGLPGV